MAAAVRAYCRPIPTRRYPPLPPSPLPAARARHRCPSEPRLPRRPLALPPPPLRRRSPEQPPRRQHLSVVLIVTIHSSIAILNATVLVSW
ncbi:Os04g0118250 [Oryza sativa Japonica Group]|uniref:Os04g0118250 protein n=1 Tax=Oryza sativa subsp. japonica TaxID=39947 RepID=A0A0P0W6T3_ORYSJ|nr:Os04g0118250 [Oryza sativa Japonica Group]